MKKEDLLISIIIPYYKTLEKTKELFDILIPQLTDEIEVLLIDDGCMEKELEQYDKITVVHLLTNSGTPSVPRNVGLNIASGRYITFIDSDDKVTEDYIKTLIKDTEENYDYYVYKWYPNDDNIYGIQHKENMFYNWNVWSYMYKKDIIGDIRFDENIVAGEDLDWLKKVLKPEYTRKERDKAIYRYNTKNENSISHLLAQGLIKARKE